MAKSNAFKMSLPAVDDLFSTEESRQEEKLKKIYELPISEIDDFPDHPYRVLDDEDMTSLMDSISERGIITPAMVRQKDDGRYEMISGHRRKHACERLGLEILRCEVVDVSRDEAIILMVDSNAQRSEILPCDKGRAYKMKLDAMKRQGMRTDLTSSPEGIKLAGKQSLDIIGEEIGESRNQIHRYIRLTHLVPELQDFVDKGQIKMRPAVELSYLDEETQRDVVDRIDETEAFPSHDQAIRICSYPIDGGEFAPIERVGNTELILVGHDHVNCFVIPHHGVRLAYALKTGSGCYWKESLNGGTKLTIGDKGAELEFVFVTPSKFYQND